MKLCFLNYRFVCMCVYLGTHKVTDDKSKAYIFANRVLL